MKQEFNKNLKSNDCLHLRLGPDLEGDVTPLHISEANTILLILKSKLLVFFSKLLCFYSCNFCELNLVYSFIKISQLITLPTVIDRRLKDLRNYTTCIYPALGSY